MKNNSATGLPPRAASELDSSGFAAQGRTAWRRHTVAGVALLALALAGFSLARWQWERAAASRARLESFAAGVADEPLAVPPADGIGARYRRIELRGRYEPRPQILLDNRVLHGAAGYEVLTPFRVAGGERVLLVNRGWLPVGADRTRLPSVDVDSAERIVAGRIDTLPRAGLALGETAVEQRTADVLVASFPTAAELEQLLGRPTFGYQVLLDPEEADGYAREWQATGLSPERHLAYAGQWALLAAGAAGAAVVLLARARRGRAERRS